MNVIEYDREISIRFNPTHILYYGEGFKQILKNGDSESVTCTWVTITGDKQYAVSETPFEIDQLLDGSNKVKAKQFVEY